MADFQLTSVNRLDLDTVGVTAAECMSGTMTLLILNHSLDVILTSTIDWKPERVDVNSLFSKYVGHAMEICSGWHFFDNRRYTGVFSTKVWHVQLIDRLQTY